MDKLEVSIGHGSETVAHILGEIVWFMSQSKQHRNSSIQELQTSVMPYILQRKFRLYRAGGVPIGVILYRDMKPHHSKTSQDDPEYKGKSVSTINMAVNPFANDEVFISEFFTSPDSKVRLSNKMEHTKAC